MSDYPLEWGWHTNPDPRDGDAPAAAPEFTAAMPTLLGGAHPDVFPIQGQVTPVHAPSDTESNSQIAQASEPPANDNRAAHEICDQAFADSNAAARIHPSLSPENYLQWRKEARKSYDDCLRVVESPLGRENFIFFHGGGIVIVRKGRSPIYVPPSTSGRAN